MRSKSHCVHPHKPLTTTPDPYQSTLYTYWTPEYPGYSATYLFIIPIPIHRYASPII